LQPHSTALIIYNGFVLLSYPIRGASYTHADIYVHTYVSDSTTLSLQSFTASLNSVHYLQKGRTIFLSSQLCYTMYSYAISFIPRFPHGKARRQLRSFIHSFFHYLHFITSFPFLSLISWQSKVYVHSCFTVSSLFSCPSHPSSPPRLVLGLDLHLQLFDVTERRVLGVKSGIGAQ
jgi:hypothetical protein